MHFIVDRRNIDAYTFLTQSCLQWFRRFDKECIFHLAKCCLSDIAQMWLRCQNILVYETKPKCFVYRTYKIHDY